MNDSTLSDSLLPQAEEGPQELLPLNCAEGQDDGRRELRVSEEGQGSLASHW